MERLIKARNFSQELEKIKDLTLEIGQRDYEVLSTAIGIVSSDSSVLVTGLKDKEKEVDGMYEQIDESCIRIIALYQPIAGDLRLVISCLKIASELERIGTYSKEIAEVYQKTSQVNEIEWPDEILLLFSQIAEETKKSLYQVLKAYKNDDITNLTLLMEGTERLKTIQRERVSCFSYWASEGEKEAVQTLYTQEIFNMLTKIFECIANIANFVWYQVYGTKVRC